MSSFRAFAWLIWVDCVLAVLAYCVADERPGLAAISMVVALLAALMMRGGLPRSLPRISINLLVLAATAHVLYRALSIGRPTITDMTDFLVYILLIKMFDRSRGRDDAQLLGLSVFVVIGAVLTSNNFLLGLMLMIYAPLTIVAAVTYQVYAGVRQGAERRLAVLAALNRVDPDPLEPGSVIVETRRGRRELLGIIALAVILCGTLSVIGFVLAPRTLTQQVLGALGEVQSGAHTEFRDSINLGQGGAISTSAEPVMDVALKDSHGEPITDRSEPIYLRGAVLDVYDGQTGQWTSSATEDGSSPDQLRSRGERPITLRGLTPGAGMITQEITVRNARDNAPLFALWRPWTIDMPDGRLAMYRGDQVPRRDLGGRFSYTITSAPNYTGGPTSDDRARIDVPPRVSELALQLAQRAGVNPDPAQREAAETRRLISTIVNHLRTQYAYDLDQTATPDGVDPIVMFLFDTRKGHCEYFAAALTCLLRSVGVPARVVTGYAAGEFNPISGVYVVRKADAHAWVEAKIRPDRWETFDATPPGNIGAQLRTSRGFFAKLRQLYEALEFGWINNVVAFDTARKIDLSDMLINQKNRFAGIRQWFDKAGAAVSSLVPGLGRWPAIILVVATLVFVLGGAGAGVRTVVRRVRTTRVYAGASAIRRDDPAAKPYLRMLRALDRAGVGKPLWRPPLRHAAELRSAHPNPRVSELVAQVAAHYYHARFGGNRTAPSSDSTDPAVAQLEAALKTKPARPAG